MPISPYFADIRRRIGTTLLLMPAVAAIVRDERGWILLQLPVGADGWSMPAGAIEPGESPAQAVVREVWEETGLRVRAARLAGLFAGERYRYVYANGDQVEAMVAVFECEVVGGELGGRDGETLELRYFPPDQMPELPLPYPRELFTGEGRSTLYDWQEEWHRDLS